MSRRGVPVSLTAILLGSAAVAGAAPAPAAAQEGAMGAYEVERTSDTEMVPMRDGVRLATDVYRPARGGRPLEERFPALLQRTPYGKSARGLVERARWFASHGYVVVLQDIRGRYDSEGVFSKYFAYDAYDGHDTIEWIAGLPYTTGRVGTWGTSYGAHTQADASKLDPPGLAALVLNFGGISNGWNHKVRRGGAFELGQQLGWAFSEAAADTDDPVVAALLASEPVERWFAAVPFRRGLSPLSAAPNFEDFILTMLQHGDYDDYWKGYGLNWAEYYEDTSRAPMLHVGGWYDPYVGSTLENYVGLARLGRPVRLLMGPWDHGGNSRSAFGDVEFGPDAAIPDFATGFHLRWFDHHLKGRDNGVDRMPAVRLFVMGTGDGHRTPEGRLFHGGYWRDEEAWPVPGTQAVAYYFQSDGTLSTRRPDAGDGSTTYRFDPHHPVPTIGGSFSGALKRGPYDQREREFKALGGGSENGFYGSRPPYLPLSARPDVVVFQTEPLEEDVEVVGPVTVRLFASSSAVDTDFTAKLVDVYPPGSDFPAGFHLNLTDGILRTRYRESPERQVWMEPGEVYEMVIELFPTANVFKRGHRIRVDISSSNFPRFDVNPNTGEPLGRHRRMVAADNTVHHDAARPSHVVLPLVRR